MTGDNLAELGYFVLLGGVILGYFLISNRHALAKLFQFGMLWGVIFVGVVALAGLWDDLERRVVPRQAVFASEGRIEVPVNRDGHFYLTLEVGDTPIRFVIDTGATDVVLSRDDAERLGFDMSTLGFAGEARTANGRVRTARVELENVGVGDLRDSTLPAYVNEGEMDTSLLGMAYLKRFEKVEISKKTMVLKR
ncbi:aspartyl protease [Brevirhabdus pacifica]|uniref:Aspartyl protease n=1 Tax=Brevirhabdus pacifica TaxID=1267768 RepID=A0A1U7DLK7_9RHOB|nr:TIGR02281 family clan AA aspartic protease [Brevirhabdus pacifica]APX90758.1 aspartyl protease [Brevirhabdus pacifica]OWU79546.1 aspartyl protease [Loktanella sp. 22II-4b]PJJ87365.1 aspartyl protease family protein [Brevirhabdus pacifica]